ncbi:MAG: type II toxin-antitoxin system Phd/YefM family antitoxin [Anaerolineales bacterium]
MSTKIMPISDLRRQASRILDLLEKEGDAVYITHYGRPVAVMVDYERYERLLARLDELTQQIEQKTAAQASATDYTAHLAGLHHEVWDGIDTDTYLQRERDAWED